LILDELQELLESNNEVIADRDNITLEEHDKRALNTAIHYFIKREKRQIATDIQRKENK